MSKTHYSVRLSPETRARLERASALSGRNPAEIVREGIEGRCAEILKTQTVAEALRDYIGSVRSIAPGNARDSRKIMEEIIDEKHRRRRRI